MGAYDFNFDVPADLTYAPSPERVKALEALLPADAFSFAPPVTDRAAWSRWQSDPFGAHVLRIAREFAAQPYPEYTDATYVACLDHEDVTQMNLAIPLVRKRQVAFLLAEAIYDQGEFLPQIDSDLKRLAALRTWIHPGNDLKRLNYELKTVESDLTVIHFMANLAETDFVLGPRLAPGVRALIRRECDRRVFAPLKQRLQSGKDLYWWIDVKHNWNAVCLACVAEAATALQSSRAERAWWLAFAESLVRNFRDGVNDDGVCTEGVSYWSYGFMHYVSLSETLRLATKGAIDLLDEPKATRLAQFPDHVELQDKVFPTYADCALDIQPMRWLRLWRENRIGSATPAAATEPVPKEIDPFENMYLQFASEPLLWMFRTASPRAPRRRAGGLGLRHWFEPSSLLICRSGPATTRRLSASLLGGNNGTNHNHNDLGTFSVVLDGRALVIDPGTEIYSFRTFSTHRYDSPLLNSFGHPVPRVAGKLQEAGPEWRTKVLAKEFSDQIDRIVFDLRMAYDVPSLRKLEREFIFDRSGAGSLTIVDRVEFLAPAAFESALITLAQFSIDGSRIRLSDGAAAVVADVTIDGAPLEIVSEVIDQPPKPTRLALRCRGEVKQATIKTVFRPA